MSNADKVGVLKSIQTEFELALQDKTTWGKNSVAKLYAEVQRNVLLKLALPS